MSNEIWMPIFGYEGLYEISTLGRVKSLAKRTKTFKNSYRVKKEIFLKPIPDKNGYVLVTLSKHGKSWYTAIHRLVALTFILTNDTNKQINHIDGNKTNNNVDNLEWVTPLENTRHAIRMGLR